MSVIIALDNKRRFLKVQSNSGEEFGGFAIYILLLRPTLQSVIFFKLG